MVENTMQPGAYFYEDLTVGEGFDTGGIVVTESQIVAFAGISGDFFDVHMDDEFARAQGFPARIAHGLLGLALTDGLKNRSRVQLMAVASLGWNWRFLQPILAGDRIAARITVGEKRLSSKGTPIATLNIQVKNQNGVAVQDGSTTLVMRMREGQDRV